MVPWTHANLSPKWHLFIHPFLHGSPVCPTFRQTQSHGMCNVCSNRPHQCDASNAAYFRLFAKMATKTTSSFLSIFVFYTLDLVENANNLEKCSLTLFSRNLAWVRKLKKLFKRITKKIHSRIFFVFCGPYSVKFCYNWLNFLGCNGRSYVLDCFVLIFWLNY